MGGQRGAIMIEAMVTMVITAVGLLGIVGMLVAGIASSNKSLYRSLVYMANEISEKDGVQLAGSARPTNTLERAINSRYADLPRVNLPG